MLATKHRWYGVVFLLGLVNSAVYGCIINGIINVRIAMEAAFLRVGYQLFFRRLIIPKNLDTRGNILLQWERLFLPHNHIADDCGSESRVLCCSGNYHRPIDPGGRHLSIPNLDIGDTFSTWPHSNVRSFAPLSFSEHSMKHGLE